MRINEVSDVTNLGNILNPDGSNLMDINATEELVL